MEYNKKVILKNNKEAWLRNGNASDGNASYEIFMRTHSETDFLRSYPDENSSDPVWTDAYGTGRVIRAVYDKLQAAAV